MKYSVVVVDDEILIAKNVAKNIEHVNSSFEVVQICSCGTEAWEYIETHLPNVVFTDIRMPEMNGLELSKKIYEKYPFIVCVIISGYNDFKYAQEAIQYQVKNYILKPINRDKLAECLEDIKKKIQVRYPNLENSASVENTKRSPQEIVQLVKEFIHQNYSDIIDLSSISRNLGFSSSYLTKIFVKCTGITPSKYLKDYRISVAKQLLSNHDLPLSFISEQTGFADQFHFSKSFKAATGMNPTEYRQKSLSSPVPHS